MAGYSVIEPDEMDLAICLYESIREMLQRGEEIKLRPLSRHCGVHIVDLQDRLKLIHIIELRTKAELGIRIDE